MQPQKKRTTRCLLLPLCRKPTYGMAHAFSSFSVDKAEVLLQESFGGESVIIEIKATCKPKTTIKYESADYRSGCVAVLLESLRDRAKLRIERLTGEILNSVLKWVS